MRRIGPFGLLAIQAVALGGCLGGGRPVIENRYSRIGGTSETPDQLLQLSVTTAPVIAPAGGVPILALGDSAQAALIVETKGKPPLRLRAAEADAAGLELLDTFERHLEVSSRPRGFLAPGDRIDAIRVRLEVAPEQTGEWRIVSWTQASNGQRTIEIGKLTDSHTSTLSASAGLAPGGIVPSASLGAESSRSVTRETILTDTTDFDAAVDEHGSAWLDETAAWRVNLAHNLSMDAVIGAQPNVRRVPRHHVVFSDPGDGKGGPARPSDVRLIDIGFYEPAAAQRPVCGFAHMTYRLRHVTNDGGATFSESDDHIAYLIGQASARFLLAPAPYRPLFGLVSAGRELAWQAGAGPRRGMLFASLAEATAFRDWAQQAGIVGGRMGNARIGFTTGPGGAIVPPNRADLATLAPAMADANRALAASAADCTTPAKKPAAEAAN